MDGCRLDSIMLYCIILSHIGLDYVEMYRFTDEFISLADTLADILSDALTF